MLQIERYRLLKLIDAISKNVTLAHKIEMMESLGDLNQEVAYTLKLLNLKSISEVREELKKHYTE